VVRRQLYAVLLFQTVVLLSAALDVIARSGATPARAVATQSRKTLAPMIGVGTSIADASERSVPPAPLGPGHPHPPSRVRVDVVFDESISPKLHATAMKEVAGIWSAYGVDVQAAGAGEPGRNGAIRLTVTIGEHPDPKGVIGTLGSIGFVDDVPEPAIVMYPNTIATLVSDAQYGGFDLHTPSAFRDSCGRASLDEPSRTRSDTFSCARAIIPMRDSCGRCTGRTISSRPTATASSSPPTK